MLVVEDEALIALDLSDMLITAGYGVLGPVASIEEALQILATTIPDAVVLDAALRGQSAAPLAQILHDKDIPFVLFTGLQCWPDGAPFSGQAVIIKPTTFKVVIKALKSLLPRQEALTASGTGLISGIDLADLQAFEIADYRPVTVVAAEGPVIDTSNS